MKRYFKEVPPSRAKGLRSFAFLGMSLALALGGVLALASTGREATSTRTAIQDPLMEAKVAYVDGDFSGAERLLRSLGGE